MKQKTASYTTRFFVFNHTHFFQSSITIFFPERRTTSFCFSRIFKASTARDQLELPYSRPWLDLKLAFQGLTSRGEWFGVHNLPHRMSARVFCSHASFVIKEALLEIVRNTGVDRVVTAPHEIDVVHKIWIRRPLTFVRDTKTCSQIKDLDKFCAGHREQC